MWPDRTCNTNSSLDRSPTPPHLLVVWSGQKCDWHHLILLFVADRSPTNTTSSCCLEWTGVWLTPPHLVVGSGKVSFLSVCRAVSKAEREESAAGERSRRKKGTAVLAGLLPEVVRKPRKQLTPEELEARRKKVSCPASSSPLSFCMNEWMVSCPASPSVHTVHACKLSQAKNYQWTLIPVKYLRSFHTTDSRLILQLPC